MIKVSVLYPNGDGSTFDMDYYLNSHIPMVLRSLGPACLGGHVDQGIASGTPGKPAAYMAMGHLLFDSVEAFQAAIAPHADAIFGDIPNYTNVQPTIQISEVKV